MQGFYIPNGVKNIAGLFPAVDFNEVEAYYIEFLDGDDTIVGTTTTSEIGGECCKDKMRIHFLNYLGAFDAINFKEQLKEHISASSTMQKNIPHPLVKSIHSINRFNVTSTDAITLVMSDYDEDDLEWVGELVDSPLIFMEWTGIQQQTDDYIPLFIEDMTYVKKKMDERWLYEVTIKVRLSHNRTIIRN